MLNPVPRGDVTYKARAQQGRDFTGLRYGNITPTDIDGVIEYHNKCYVFYEAKHENAPPMSDGQRMALERICDDLKKPSLLVLCKHRHPAEQAIDFAVCDVESVRYKGKWITLKSKAKVKEVTDWFIGKYGA
jgi:hypothetical protein